MVREGVCEGIDMVDVHGSRRSKQEMYIDILRTLRAKGPLRLTHIMYKANVNCSVLKGYLDNLIRNGMVEEQSAGRTRILYSVTNRARQFLSFADISERMFSYFESKKHLPTLGVSRTSRSPIEYTLFVNVDLTGPNSESMGSVLGQIKKFPAKAPLIEGEEVYLEPSLLKYASSEPKGLPLGKVDGSYYAIPLDPKSDATFLAKTSGKYQLPGDPTKADLMVNAYETLNLRVLSSDEIVEPHP